VRQIPLLFEMVEQRSSGTQDAGVLLGRKATEVARADVTRTAAEHLRFVPVTMALNQRIIDRHVAASLVFDKESQLRSMVKQLSQHLRPHRKVIRRQFGAICPDCAEFHVFLSVCAKTGLETILEWSAKMVGLGAADEALASEMM
jgi:hypothetical protein